MLQSANAYVVLTMVGKQLKMTVLTEKNVATVKTLIDEEARYTMQEIKELTVN